LEPGDLRSFFIVFSISVVAVDEVTVDDTIESIEGESPDGSVNVTEGYAGLKMYVGRKVRVPFESDILLITLRLRAVTPPPPSLVGPSIIYSAIPSKTGFLNFHYPSSTSSTSGRIRPIPSSVPSGGSQPLYSSHLISCSMNPQGFWADCGRVWPAPLASPQRRTRRPRSRRRRQYQQIHRLKRPHHRQKYRRRRRRRPSMSQTSHSLCTLMRRLKGRLSS
jgi:hypothetical protein